MTTWPHLRACSGPAAWHVNMTVYACTPCEEGGIGRNLTPTSSRPAQASKGRMHLWLVQWQRILTEVPSLGMMERLL